MPSAQQQATDILTPLIEGFRTRLDTVLNFMVRTEELLGSLRGEQDTMIRQLQDRLAQSRSLRRSDFQRIIGDLLCQRRDKHDVLSGQIAQLWAEGEEIIRELESLAAKDLPGARRAWEQTKQKIHFLQTVREREVTRALKQVHLEHQELSTALDALLAKEERLRIGDLKTAVRTLHGTAPGGATELAGLVKRCEAACHQADHAWCKVS